ncbi:MAG: phage regulatory protein/antirepressor Ant [Actinomycetia bacterium]|nr:phage regulatory protein/antirepressor Ant [Actinomycetes bacterium]
MSDIEPINGDLVFVDDKGEAFTTSLVIAAETENEHASVIKLIRDNTDDLNEVGRVRFEIRPFETPGGVQRREIAELDEPASALLMTYLRNSPVVKDFKKRLVAGFYAMRQTLAERPALSGPELVATALIEANRMLEQKDERIAELEPKAEIADKFLDAEGDLSVRDAAQSLTRAGVKVGGQRLFAALEHKGWIRRAAGDGRYRVIQSAIETGYMSVLPQSHYHPKTGVLVLDPPQPRVTPKGLQRLLTEYGANA